MKEIPILPAIPGGATARGASLGPTTAPANDTRRGQCGVPAGPLPRPAIARTAAAIIATTALALLAAACGGGSPSSTASGGGSNVEGSTNSQSTNSHQVAFSRCMRSNGVINYPDPDSSGVIPKESSQQLGVASSTFQSAQDACQRLLPNGGNGPNQAELRQERAQGLRFAQCMRTHGVALPDPDSSGRIPDPASGGIDQGSPQFEAANQACGEYRPPYIPSNAAYNSYAQTHGS
jgi:hypothetical protein